MKKYLSGIFALLLTLWMGACSDEPDAANYYTFKGEMMSQYLTSRPQFSQYAQIVERAGLMKLLSAYGTYTCFAP
ncbi:MAG: fasciclin, partial [Bacteroidaceae bacterium]|nr:fasciclin [Bacteroidaceae bacterium]